MIRGLNLGCGSKIIPDAPRAATWINTDIAATHPAVRLWDLEQMPWPWVDGEFNKVLAEDVFEHISPWAACGFMSECWRVLEPGGELILRVPHWQHHNAWTDPTHFRGCTEWTFDYWTVGTELYARHNAAYGGARFHQKDRQLDGYDLVFVLERLA